MSYEERNFEMPSNFEVQETIIKELGPLYGRGGEYKRAYSGDISVDKPEDQTALSELNRLDLDLFYEPAQYGAPEDCGDERPATTIVDAMLRPLGPQNMGGTSSNALVWGLVTGRQESHLRVIAALNTEYLNAGVEYRPGGHCAEGAHGYNCGCAAIDFIPEVNQAITDPARRTAHHVLTAHLVGFDRFNDQAYRTNLEKYSRLSHRLGSYLPAGYQNDSLNLMRSLSPDIEPVNKRVGKHQGLMVVANRVPGTRLNQDILATTPSRVKRPFQAFGVDTWYAAELAEKLFPNDIVAQQEFEIGRAMYDAGALLAITDGSLELRVRDNK